MNNIKDVIEKIKVLAEEIGREVVLMELCGTHTQAVKRYGIKEMLPANIKLLTGPGCPVCVTAQVDIDSIVKLALSGVPVASYGDVLRVPGHLGSLEEARANGAKVFGVYSVDEAMRLQAEHDDLVFFGLGFETTTPATAYAVKNGLTVYSTHKLFLPAMQALLDMGEIRIDGFLNPGHVSAIIGTRPYEKIKQAQVIAGFKAEDVLVAIYLLLKQIKEGRQDVENEYLRAVSEDGNRKAYDLIFEVFEARAGVWRGFGEIPGSGLELKSEYKEFDAKVKYKDILDSVDKTKAEDLAGCRCGEVIRGLISPRECKLFGSVCTPDKPFGPCMVSVEGGCCIAFGV